MINETLKNLRKQHGVNQTSMAKMLGLSPSYLCHLEQGLRPVKYDLLERYADIFGVPVSALAFLTELPKGGYLDAENFEEVVGDKLEIIQGWARRWKKPDATAIPKPYELTIENISFSREKDGSRERVLEPEAEVAHLRIKSPRHEIEVDYKPNIKEVTATRNDVFAAGLFKEPPFQSGDHDSALKAVESALAKHTKIPSTLTVFWRDN